MNVRGATYYLVKSKRGIEIWPARERDIDALLKLKPGFELIDGFKTAHEARWQQRRMEARAQLSTSASAAGK